MLTEKTGEDEMTEFKRKDGYICVMINNGKYLLKHRLIMEKHLNRLLGKHEVVHHVNGIRDDNRLSNLLVCTQSQHCKLEGFGSRLKGIPKTKEHIANWKRSRWKK